jgi:uncharacterized protein YyaL (SSP411 family)
MCANLYYLSVIFDIPEWGERAMAMVKGMAPLFIKYPTSFGSWILCLQWFTQQADEISIIGKNRQALLAKLNEEYLPFKILQSAEQPQNNFPLIKDKLFGSEKTFLYLCKNYTCKKPVETIPDLLSLLKMEL